MAGLKFSSKLSKPKDLEEEANKAIESKLDELINRGGDSANGKIIESTTKKKSEDPNKITSFTFHMPRYKMDEIRERASKVQTNDLLSSYSKKKSGISMQEWIVRVIEKELSKEQ